MIGLGPLLRKELLEAWRTRRMLVVAAVFTAFGIASPFLARYLPELIEALAGGQFEIVLPPPSVGDAADQFLKNVGQAGILTAVLLAMGSVAVEKERGTAALVLSKPASRGAYLLAKMVAITVTLGVGLALASAGGYAYTALLFEALPPIGWAAMTGLLLLELVAYAALTFLGSVLARSSVAAAAIGVGGLLVVALISALPTIGAYTPGGLSGPARALALGTDAGGVIGPVLVNLGLVAALLLVAWLAFRRQEL
ncbi:MAG: ABC transporter permease [Chloroflexota bacterium]|nr:ABC transporter permease [Chloroflexota bacterium]